MNLVPRKSNEAVRLVSDTMPVSFTDTLGPVTQFLKYGNGAADNDSGKQFDAIETPNLESNTRQFGVLPLDTEDGARRLSLGDRGSLESVTELSQGAADFSSQVPSHGFDISRTRAFPQTPGSYELQRPADTEETYPFYQTSDFDFPGLSHSGPFQDDLFSKFSIPPVYAGNGGNSHFSEDGGSMAHLDPALDGWKELSKFNSGNDAFVSQNVPPLDLFRETPRFGGGTASPTYYFGGSTKSMQAQEQPTSQESLGNRVAKRRVRPGRRTIYVPVKMDDCRGSLYTPRLKMADTSEDSQHREALVGKRKRTDGGPQDVLEGIFIVTRRPKNGQTKSIADLIGWTFQEVNEWFEKRALWEVSHTSSTMSQDLDMLSASTTINLLSQDPGDSGFFELPGSLADTTLPKKRLKRQPPSGTKIKDAGDFEDEKEAKTYPCIHENCAYNTDKFGEWKRHMASVHYPGRWACLLAEENQTVPADNRCPSCGITFGSVRDLKQHIHLSPSCPDILAVVRVFDRKDKLLPHWEKWHKVDTRSKHLGDDGFCERDIRDFDEECGFCELSFTNWDTKIEHVGIHFKDEGRKMSTWRYPPFDDGRSTLQRSLIDGHALPDDLLFDSDVDSSDSDDSDGDDEGDRPKMRTYSRRDDRDRDKGGNSGSGGTPHPPPDGGGREGGDSSSKKSEDNAKYGRGSYARHGGRSVQEREAEAGDNASTTTDPYRHLESHYLRRSGAVPLHQNIRRLGSGGSGAVNEIRIEGTNQVVARKRIRRLPDQNIEIAKELEMIRTLQDLDHPHIVRFLGAYTTDTYIDILMLPVADYDLNDFMLQQQPPVSAAVKSQMAGFISCLASAMKYIHERDIRHRDIKPKNILVANGIVLIADFGSASDTYHEAGNKVVGVTPKYTAPEVLNGGRPGRAADIWSLGCVFMELVTIIHDKTLSEFEHFRSSNARFKAAQPFHRTIGEMHEWLKVLPRAGAAPSLMWQGVSYLDTIAKMLQEDEGKRPTATELLRRFSPSYCCSINMEYAKNSLFLDRPMLIEPTMRDVVYALLSNSWDFYLPDSLPDTKGHAFKSMELSEFVLDHPTPPTSVWGTEIAPKKIPSLTGKETVLGTQSFYPKGAEIQNIGCITPSTSDECGRYDNSTTNETEKTKSSRFLSDIMSLRRWRKSMELLGDKFNIKMPQPNQENKGAEDPILGRSVFCFNGEGPAGIKQGRRRHYMREERREAAKTRKHGACDKCRVAKIKCLHDPLPATADQYSVDLQRHEMFALGQTHPSLQANEDKKRHEMLDKIRQIDNFLPTQDQKDARWRAKTAATLLINFDVSADLSIIKRHNADDERWGRHGDIKSENILWFGPLDSDISGTKSPGFGMRRFRQPHEKGDICPGSIHVSSPRSSFTDDSGERGGSPSPEYGELFIDRGVDMRNYQRKRPGIYKGSTFDDKWPVDTTQAFYDQLEDHVLLGIQQEDGSEPSMDSFPKHTWEKPASLESYAQYGRRIFALSLFRILRYATPSALEAEYDPVIPVKPVPPSSADTTGCRVQALFDFQTTEPDELSFRRGDIIEMLGSVYKEWWKGSVRGEIGIFPLNYDEKIPGSMPEELEQAQTEEDVFAGIKKVVRQLTLLIKLSSKPMEDEIEIVKSYISPPLSTRPTLLELIRKDSRQKDDIRSLGEEFNKALRDYEALIRSSSPNPHSENLRQVWFIDSLDEQGSYEDQEYGFDSFLSWALIYPDRDDLIMGGNQSQHNFHWFGYPAEKPICLYVIPKTGDRRGQGDDFMRMFTGSPKRLKEMEGYSTLRNASPCEFTRL